MLTARLLGGRNGRSAERFGFVELIAHSSDLVGSDRGAGSRAWTAL